MIFDSDGVRVDCETVSMDELEKAFSFFADLVDSNLETIRLSPEAGTCNDIHTSFHFVLEYNASPSHCQRTFDRTFLRVAATCDFLGARFVDKVYVMPLRVLHRWVERTSVADIHDFMLENVPRAYEKLVATHAASCRRALNSPRNVIPSASNTLWRSECTLPPVLHCLLNVNVFSSSYDVSMPTPTMIETLTQEQPALDLVFSMLTNDQKMNAEKAWIGRQQPIALDHVLHTMLVALRNERCLLIGNAQKAQHAELAMQRRIHETESELETLTRLIKSPESDDIKQFIMIGTIRARPAVARNLTPPGSGPFYEETPIVFSARNQNVLRLEVPRIESKILKRRNAFEALQSETREIERSIAAIDEWLMCLVEAATTNDMKRTFFEMTTVEFQIQSMACVILNEFHLPPPCRDSLMQMFCTMHKLQADELQLALFDRVPCDFPKGCRHSNGTPSPAKQIQLHDENGALVALPSGNSVIWRAGHSTAQTHQATMDWNTSIDILTHVRKDGVRGLHKVARCGYHGGGREGAFPGSTNDDNRKRQRIL
jgi:hypothetical protein